MYDILDNIILYYYIFYNIWCIDFYYAEFIMYKWQLQVDYKTISWP
jgi:hypothetical protein